MTDVTVAPAGGESAPASTPSEVVIDQNPVNPPPPIGSQAPDKPAEQKPQPSRRDTIKAAFDRAVKAQESGERSPPASRTTARPAAEAKAGHNQPPEETKPERSQPHREQGRFARAPSAATTPEQPNAAPAEQPAKPPVKQLPPNAPYREPPARLADHAKADWADTPERVRGEVHRMHQEFGKAYQYYKGAHEAFQPVRQYHELAQSHGTTLAQALHNYTSMEAKLRADPIAGLDVIVNNLGLKTADGQQLGLRDIAYHVLSSTPEQLRQVQQGNQQTAAANQIGALHQEIAGLKSYLQQMHTQQQFTYSRSTVDQFADQHPRFDELGDLIEQELKFGWTLDEAYRRAELLRPTTQAAQTRDPSAQTRPPDRSISGAPSGGPSNGHDRSARPKGPPPSRQDAITRAIRHVRGAQ